MTEINLFQGKLVRLSVPLPEDAAAFARWTEDPDYMRMLDTDFARPRTKEEMEQRHGPGSSGGSDSILFHLRTVEGDCLIGFLALFNIEWNNQAATLAMGIGEKEYRGKGYGSEALRLILNYAFNELNLHRIGLDVIANNQPAIRAYEKAGFRLEGRMREGVYRDGQRVDRLIMGILRDEWLAHEQKQNAARTEFPAQGTTVINKG